MFKLEYFGDDYRVFSDSTILPSGQTAYIQISLDSASKVNYCPIYFVIYHKRRQELATENHITGKDGVLGLFWAKEKIIEFEQFVQERVGFDDHKKHVLYCTWTDNRRRNAYTRGLIPLGFKYMNIFGKKALGKVIYEP